MERQADTAEIEITPEMIEAGALALVSAETLYLDASVSDRECARLSLLVLSAALAGQVWHFS